MVEPPLNDRVRINGFFHRLQKTGFLICFDYDVDNLMLTAEDRLYKVIIQNDQHILYNSSRRISKTRTT